MLRKIMTMPQGPKIDVYTLSEIRYIKTLIILFVNNHTCQHKPSCFKKSKRTQYSTKPIYRVFCRTCIPKILSNTPNLNNLK